METFPKSIIGLERVPPTLRSCVLTVGNFDGVHVGHQQILRQARALASDTGGGVVVLTFEPHPLAIVAPDRAPRRLMTEEQRTACLLAAGADAVVVARSDSTLLSMEPADFVRQIIAEKFAPTHVVEGESFGFGKGRRGNPQLLKKLGILCDFETEIVEPITLPIAGESVAVTSSLIRRLLGNGQVEQARECLGRPYALTGEIRPGQGRGRSLGYPTANLAEVRQLIPAPGVYAGMAEVEGEPISAAVSIGSTPTFGGEGLQIEAHLLDCSEDLYGRQMTLEFLQFLRKQRRFDSPAELVRQIQADVESVRRSAAAEGPTNEGDTSCQ